MVKTTNVTIVTVTLAPPVSHKTWSRASLPQERTSHTQEPRRHLELRPRRVVRVLLEGTSAHTPESEDIASYRNPSSWRSGRIVSAKQNGTRHAVNVDNEDKE